jgi:hypothetical protein
VCHLAKAGCVERRLALATIDAAQAPVEIDNLRAGEARVKIRRLRQKRKLPLRREFFAHDVLPRDERVATVRARQAGEHAHRCALARAFGPTSSVTSPDRAVKVMPRSTCLRW